jgi:hypothetical protein
VTDWTIFLANGYTNLSGLSPAESYGRGDLDGDGDNDRADFLLFKLDYNAANGSGAFEAMLGGVPEPASAAFVACGLAMFLTSSRRLFAQRRQAADKPCPNVRSTVMAMNKSNILV